MDGLRGIAILLVLGVHYFHETSYSNPAADTQGPFPFFGALFAYGDLGVELFFLISGFVIALTLETSKTPYDFFVRRFARLWPALFVCSIITFLVVSSVSTPYSLLVPQHLSNFLPSLTLTPGYLWSWYFPGAGLVDGVYWSLIVEVRFYLVVAVIFWSFKRSSLGRNLVIFTYLNILSRAALQRVFPGSNALYSEILIPDFMPWFAAGAVFYELYMTRISPKLAVLLLCSMIAIIFRTSTFVGDSARSPFVISGYALLFFIAFWSIATRAAASRLFEARLLVWVGICSYSVYLLHNAIGRLILTAIPGGVPFFLQFFAVLSVIVAMVAVGYISFVLVEQPARRYITACLLKDRRPNQLSTQA